MSSPYPSLIHSPKSPPSPFEYTPSFAYSFEYAHPMFCRQYVGGSWIICYYHLRMAVHFIGMVHCCYVTIVNLCRKYWCWLGTVMPYPFIICRCFVSRCGHILVGWLDAWCNWGHLIVNSCWYVSGLHSSFDRGLHNGKQNLQVRRTVKESRSKVYF